MRLGDLDALKKAFDRPFWEHWEWDLICKTIDNAPTVELTEEQAIDKLHETGWLIRHDKEMTERPQGEWIEENSETGALGIKYTWFKCNQCGWDNSLVIPKNFCPNCGADMRGDKE